MIYTKIPYTLPQDIFKLYDANTNIHMLAGESTTPHELINMALSREYYSDAVTFLAHALPVRESVWWATMCAITRSDWNTTEMKAISAARAWVYAPNETARRYAEKLAKDAQLHSGAGWVAQAVFWSSGSMTAPEDPSVSPPQFLYAHAVAGSINLSAVLPDGEHAIPRYKNFLKIGLNIAHGGNGSLSGK
ncbi:hypothetical protein NLN86_23645 [Citrobacter portucalensis]|uniref:Twin-arginine translocation pathway signal n=1 Tax=Citrobacter portucalensis TaxID=1639133 RepID=A0AAW5WF93_9ENTR|nr:hypothetical protein [Citrobacter portucalensis]MCX9004613.1 hypothetical protein [Citrobacter portucalensis]MCX9059030.1 hypothetical protein [Citrobacter portucalensis]